MRIWYWGWRKVFFIFMFGISFFELIILAIVALVFIRPSDLPEVAYFCGRVFYRVRRFYYFVKNYLSSWGSEFGLDEIKYEINKGIADEKANIDDESTVIIDMEGNEHRVNLNNVDRDVDSEEIEQLNSKNKV